MHRLGLICNRRSRRLARKWPTIAPLLDRLIPVARADLDGIDGLREALHSFAEAKVETIAILGGDGTVQAICSLLINEKPFGDRQPDLIVLPGGTTNLIARELGVRGSTARALSLLQSWMDQSDDTAMRIQAPILTLTLGDGGAPHHGFVFGTAAFYEGTLLARRRVQSLGLADDLAAGLSTIYAVIKSIFVRGPKNKLYQPHAIRWRFNDGRVEEGPYFFVLASVLPRLVWNMRPFWGGRAHDMTFYLTRIAFPPRRLLRALWPFLRGRPKPWMKQAGYDSQALDQVSLALSCPVILDGEIFSSPGQDIILSCRHRLSFIQLEGR